MGTKNLNSVVMLSFVFGAIALMVLLIIAVFVNEHNPLLITISRIVLALACAGIAAVIPGFIELNLKHSTVLALRSGGAIAVFVLVFFFNPPGLIQPVEVRPPNPSEDYMSVVDNWLEMIDKKEYVAAYESASKSTKEDYSREFFVKLFSGYLSPLGSVKKRELMGAATAEKLPSGEKGNFRVIQYKTVFEHGPEQFETLVLSANNGRWKVKDHSLNINQMSSTQK